MERMANRVFIIGNLGEKSGYMKGQNSMRIILNELQKHIHDVPIHYLPNPNMDDFLERKNLDEFADNCIYVCENLNFQPEEFGYVEPKPKPEEEKPAEQQEEVISGE